MGNANILENVDIRMNYNERNSSAIRNKTQC